MSSITLELVYTAWDLAPFARDLGYQSDRFQWDEERRSLLRAKLEGINSRVHRLLHEDNVHAPDVFSASDSNQMAEAKFAAIEDIR